MAVRDVDAWLTTEFLLLLPERPNIACELFPDSFCFTLAKLDCWARISLASYLLPNLIIELSSVWVVKDWKLSDRSMVTL